MEKIMEIIKNNAPHGSGIDYDYEMVRVSHYSTDNENKLIFENAYHMMDENGFYDGIAPFRVVVGQNLIPEIHFLGLNRSGRYRVYEKYDLKPYLEEIYYNYINNDKELLKELTRIL